MILSDSEILKQLRKGNIVIEPFNPAHLNPNSVDLTLAAEYYVWKRDEPYLDSKRPANWAKRTITEQGLTLLPNFLYIASTNEVVGTPCKNRSIWDKLMGNGFICGDLAGKSSNGRNGLSIHATAGFKDTGFVGQITLEITVTHPLKVYANMKVGQMKFQQVKGEVLEPYGAKPGSKYMNQTGAQTSLMHKNFE